MRVEFMMTSTQFNNTLTSSWTLLTSSNNLQAYETVKDRTKYNRRLKRIQKVLNKYTGNFAVRKTVPNVHSAREMVIAELDSLHPSVIRYHLVEQDNNNHYFIMDYFREGDLLSFLQPKLDQSQFNTIYSTGVLIEREQVWRYLAQLVSCLEWLHDTAGVAHRDIKSENVLLDDDKNVVLVNFDSARRISRDGSCVFNTDVGTTLYRPPEIDQRTSYSYDVDFYCLGALLYEIYTGNFMFRPTEEDGCQSIPDFLRKLKSMKLDGSADFSKVSPEFREIIEGLVSLDPNERVNTFQGLLQNEKLLRYREKYRVRRPRFCTNFPWPDCTCLIVSDRAKQLWKVNEIDQFGKLAQVLLVNVDKVSVTPDNYRGFLLHLQNFILKDKNMRVEFMMTCVQFSNTLTSGWRSLLSCGSFDEEENFQISEIPICLNPYTCEHLYGQTSDEAKVHLKERKHVCRFSNCKITDPDHFKYFLHFSKLPRCCASSRCRGINDPAHRFRFSHPIDRFIPYKCYDGAKCRKQNNRNHIIKYGHWVSDCDGMFGLKIDFDHKFQNQLTQLSQRYPNALVNLFSGEINETAMELLEVLLHDSVDSLQDAFIYVVGRERNNSVLMYFSIDADAFCSVFSMCMKELDFNTCLKRVFTIITEILFWPLLKRLNNFENSEYGRKITALKSELLDGSILLNNVDCLKDFVEQWFQYLTFNPPANYRSSEVVKLITAFCSKF
ncbi:hypothetical protein GEMRC1_000177 [Eukaryota sp. GEM-RC1]